MSTNDQTPTQYFGPGVRRVGLRGGGYLQIPAEHYDTMVASGEVIALSPEEEIADILELANARHVSGCSIERTGKCICDYIGQWPVADTAGTMSREDAESLFKEPGRLLPTGEDVMAELDELREEMTLGEEMVLGISEQGSRPRCTAHPYSWHYPDTLSCSGFEEMLMGGHGFTELSEHPEAMVKYAAQLSNKMVEAAQREAADEKLRAKYWHKEYKQARKQWWYAVVFASVCAAALGTVLAWAGVL